MKIAVVGAGLHGVLATKICMEYGLEVQCFEKFYDLGGTWRYDAKLGRTSVMKSTVTNQSKEFMSFSDFPPADHSPNFVHHTGFLAYVEKFVENYDVRKCIQFNTEVTKIERNSDYEITGRWKLSYKNLKTDENFVKIFDGVMVVTGRQVKPVWPEFVGQAKFTGRLMHSHDYRDDTGFEDRRVLIVGVGNSGTDIACELAPKCSKVYFSTRNGCWFVSRTLIFGYPMDLMLHRRFVSWISKNFPSLVNSVVEFFANFRFKHSLYGLKCKYRIFEHHRPTNNEEIQYRILSGQVLVKPQIEQFMGGRIVKFSDGSEIKDVDDVIVCTGYEATFPFVEKGVVNFDARNDLDLYRFMYPPHLDNHPTLCFIGMINPPSSITHISELQARFHCELLLNHVNLPSAREMRQLTTLQNEGLHQVYASNANTSPVDHVSYMDELAGSFGAKPSIWAALREGDWRLAAQLAFGPLTPYQYRLQGPHSWSGAREATLNVWDRAMAPLHAGRKPLVAKNGGIGLAVEWTTNFWCWLLVFFSLLSAMLF